MVECYCDNALSNATTLQSNSSCNMACAGNPSEVCGGSGLLTIYYANAPVPQGPHTNSGPPGWTSAGCWADGPNKALANGVDVPGGGDNMTVIECTSACGAAGYTLAGVEYASKSSFGCACPGTSVCSHIASGQCFCDNYLAASATNVTLKDCNMPCNGNSSEFCGAGNHMNIYSSGSTTASVKAQTLALPPPGGWFDLGCYNDSNADRTLSVTQYIQVPMTIEACTSSCAQDKYTFAGLEYAGESQTF